MPLIAIIDSRLPDLEPAKPKPVLYRLRRTKQCPHCGEWFVPGGGFTAHNRRCARIERPQRFFERPDYLRLMGDTF